MLNRNNNVTPSVSDTSLAPETNNAGNKPYPYEDKIEYIPSEIQVSRLENGYIAYNQITDVDENIADLYAKIYDSCQLKRDFHPIFNSNKDVTFSRISDTSDSDKERYAEYLQYGGEKTADLLYMLVNLPQQRDHAIQCILLQKGRDAKTVAIGAKKSIYDNCSLNTVMSNDLSKVSGSSVQRFIKDLQGILNTNRESQITTTNISTHFFYQQRVNLEKDMTEERYIYYAYFENEGMQYLCQFTSNYTLKGSSQNAYGANGETQEKCREAFENILSEFISAVKS